MLNNPNTHQFADSKHLEKSGLPRASCLETEFRLADSNFKKDPEKAALLVDRPRSHPRDSKASAKRFVVSLILIAIFARAVLAWLSLALDQSPEELASFCPRQPIVKPLQVGVLEKKREALQTPLYFNRSLALLSSAVRINTEIHDDAGNSSDPRFVRFADFGNYLEESFALLHEKLDLEIVNKYGRLYTWRGKQNLKPVVFMAHIDVVPAGDHDAWQYPPFDAVYKDDWLYGRGVVDCKNLLIALMESVTALLEAGFQPDRTILLSFGYDEELVRNNNEGAAHLAHRIEEIYGPNGIEVILDEGGNGITQLKPSSKVQFALPATSEKGYVDTEILVRTAGGHSSLPPVNTGIGIMAEIAVALEKADSAHHRLSMSNPVFSGLACTYTYDKTSLGAQLQKALERAVHSGARQLDAIAELWAKESSRNSAIVRTTQALDVIRGGVKSNALPEHTTLVSNYRIALEDSVSALQQRLTEVIRPIAKKHSLPFDSNGHNFTGHGVSFRLINPLAPAPISATDSEPWHLFSGAIRHVFGTETIVAPSVMTGNTDTKEYHRLSPNIYRFIPGRPGQALDIHAVNERLYFPAHIQLVDFYFELMRIWAGKLE